MFFTKLFSAAVTAVTGQPIKDLTVEQAADAVAQGALLVDLREEVERRHDGTIPGAIAVRYPELAAAADPASPDHRPELATDRPLVLFCAVGGRSAHGVAILEKLGYQDVAHLAGGIRAWRSAGHPVDKR